VTRFKKDFLRLLKKLKNGENFAFSRYSDGEVFVMQGKKLVLATDHVIVDNVKHGFGYPEDDYKHFDPEENQDVQDKLLQAFSYEKKNYFVGVGCGNCTCAIREHIPWLLERYKNGADHMTTPNLFVNANYPLFISHYIPEFKKKKIVLVCSENADLTEMPFEVVKDFRVGRNCIVNDHGLAEVIKQWISDNDVQDHVFLFSASSLSEILIHELFKSCDKNTYIDIGTTLHKYMKLGNERNYLRAYWGGQNRPELFQICNW
jgi:hypothetical protein